MQMWTIRASCRSHVTDNVAGAYVLAFLYRSPRHMHIDRLNALPVIDRYCAAAQVEFAPDHDNTGCHSANRAPRCAALVEAGMEVPSGLPIEKASNAKP